MDALILMVLIGWCIFGPNFWLWPIRLPAYLLTKKNHNPHVFDAHIRKDIGTITNFCDVCNKYRGNWIHVDQDEVNLIEKKNERKLLELERADIKWRFSNDPEWVKVFGDEYDPKTFEPIPLFHNGECGGALDSCPRCNWEFNQKDSAEDAKRYYVDFEKSQKRKQASAAEARLTEEEAEGYSAILWTLWNTVHDFEEAQEEWEDLRDEIGMLKNDDLRKKVKGREVFERLTFCLAKPEQRWNRREEVWQNELKRRRDNERYRSMDYY